MPFSAYPKKPNTEETITLDWVPYLGTGDGIAQSTWPISPSGISATTSYDAVSATIKLSGGTEGQDYAFTNRVVTDSGDTYEWDLTVSVSSILVVPDGPPFATVQEAQAYQPGAQGADSMKVEMVLADASDIVAAIAPEPPDEIKTTLTLDMDASQKTASIADPYDFPEWGTISIDNEVIYYSDKSTLNGLQFTRLKRGRLATVATSHLSGAEVKEVSYAIRARRAELFVFEWLWDTRAYIPSKTGVVGSASYDLSDNVLRTVKRIMGHSSGPHGGIQKVVPIASFRRKGRRSPLDFQRG